MFAASCLISTKYYTQCSLVCFLNLQVQYNASLMFHDHCAILLSFAKAITKTYDDFNRDLLGQYKCL